MRALTTFLSLFLTLLTLFLAPDATAQVGSTASTCIWSGSLADCLPATGINLSNNRVVRFGELSSNGTDYVALVAPTSVTGARTATFPDATGNVVLDSATQTLTNKTINGSNNTITNVSLTSGVTGVLPLANGGTNKNATAVNGGLVWSDADSMEITAAGTAQQWVLSGGAGTPTMSNTTTTAKVIDGSADAVQLLIEGNATQTSDIFDVRKSDGTTFLLQTTNTLGTAIRGTTSGAAAAATGFVGEYIQVGLVRSSGTSLTSTNPKNVCGPLSLTAGDWNICGMVGFFTASTTNVTRMSASISMTSATPAPDDTYADPSSGEVKVAWQQAAAVPGSGSDMTFAMPCAGVRLTGSQDYYLVANNTFTLSTMGAYGAIWARRVR